MLNREMGKSLLGRQILEEEKKQKESERMAKLPPPEPPKPPSPKFKTVKKLR